MCRPTEAGLACEAGGELPTIFVIVPAARSGNPEGQACANSELAAAIETGAAAGATPTTHSSPTAGADLVEIFARINGLLDLVTTADTETLTARLWSDGGSDIVLTTEEESAYSRLAERMNTMWAQGDDLDHWTY